MRILTVLVASLSLAVSPLAAQDGRIDMWNTKYLRLYGSISVGLGVGASRFVEGLDLARGAEAYDATIGVDVGRFTSIEFDAGYVEFDVTTADRGKVGELTLATFVPQLRLRVPLRDGRLMPWVAGGVGLATLAVNDRTLAGVDVFSGPLAYTLGLSADGGIEYFMAPNLGITIQLKYLRATRDITLIEQMRSVEGVGAAASGTLGFRLYAPRSPPEGLFRGVTWPEPTGLRGGLYFSFAFGLRGYRDRSVTPEARLDSTDGGEQTTTVAVGVELDPRLSVEVTGLFHEIPIRTSVKLVEFATWLIAPQVRVRFPGTLGPVVPHAMVGVGLGLGQTNDVQPPNASDPVGGFSGQSTALAATVGVGLSLAVERNIHLVAEAHYLHHRSSLKRAGVPLSIDVSAIQIEGGLRVFLR